MALTRRQPKRDDMPGPPFVDRALVEYLEEKFPDECPRETDPTFLYRRQGALEVVRFLRRTHDAQEG